MATPEAPDNTADATMDASDRRAGAGPVTDGPSGGHAAWTDAVAGAAAGRVPHSAAASVLGYAYQTKWGLLELLRNRVSHPDLALTLEMHDDVAWEDGHSSVELKQLKLHVTTTRHLGDASVDLWRTIGVWLDNGRPSDPYGPVLTLVTTARAPDGSAAAWLRAGPGNRSPSVALALLEAAAVDSDNVTTAKVRMKFLALDPSERAVFVSRIHVADQSADLDGVDAEVAELLIAGAPMDHFQTYLDQVWGWWARAALQLLRGRRPPFTVPEVLHQLNRIRDQFTSDNLPPLVDSAEIDVDKVRAEHADRVYVKQMKWVDLGPRNLNRAIIDYEQAYMQATRWLDRHLVGYVELDAFIDRLKDEWEREFEFMCDDLPADATEADKKRAGKDLLRQLGNSALTIRARFNDPFFARGQRHALADNGDIGWHPEFEQHLAALLLSDPTPA